MTSRWHILTLFAALHASGCSTADAENQRENMRALASEASASASAPSDAGELACRSDLACPAPDPLSNVPWTCVAPFSGYACGPFGYGPACSHDSDCGRAEVCQDVGRGDNKFICAPGPDCTTDADCSDGRLCYGDPRMPAFTTIFPISSKCLHPCSDDQHCAPSDKCSADGHCRPRSCAECPSYFACSDGRCFAPECTNDKDCPGGVCVNGTCGAALGTCKPACL